MFVYVRAQSTWIFQAYIKALNAEADDQFGASHAIWDDTLAVVKLDRPSAESQLLRGRSSRVHFFAGADDDGAGVGIPQATRRPTAPEAGSGPPDARWSGDPSGALQRSVSRRRN